MPTFLGHNPDDQFTLPPDADPLAHPAYYQASKALAKAVNIALRLDKPLLLTGAPGTGKSQLAERIAWEFRHDPDWWPEALRFETKSLSEAHDLFYHYDPVGRLAAAQLKEPSDPRGFIAYAALGEAILRALPPAAAAGHWPSDQDMAHRRAQRCVVLIDEIDKAPRDFPNDLLNEIDRLQFRVRELGNRVIQAPPGLKPLVIISSNSEKELPDPFLRRCLFHHIDFPDEATLAQIVERRISAWLAQQGRGGVSLRSDKLLQFFYACRQAFDYQPSTSEALQWLLALHLDGARLELGIAAANLTQLQDHAGVLAKKKDDLGHYQKLLKAWGEAGPG